MSMPPSSPRLPSPPPPTEIQIGPKSPSVGSFSNQEPTIEQSIIDANAVRRIHPGTKAANMAAGPPLVPLGELDSAFQLQEHLKALHYHYTKSDDSDSITPITRETALLIAAQPEGVDRALWLYELCRFLINKCNDLIIGFLFDDPPCSATTCPEMRASEWQFLCAVHESPKSCCAIDYCCHTLDWATNIVTSQKIFPSRLSLGAGDSLDPRGAGEKHLTNIFRRLHRIFAHAWFQHRGVFWQVEGQTGLYVLFKTVCDTYDLLPAENYKLPPEAEGLEPAEDSRPLPPSIMKSTKSQSSSSARTSSTEEDFISVPHTNTRRHIRGSPSVGSAVTTVLESDEEDPDVTQKLEELNIDDEDDTIVDIPVVVETYAIDEGDEDEDQAKPVNTIRDEQEPVSADILESGPPTAALDKTFFDNLEEKDEPEGEVERLIVDESDSLDSPEAETPILTKQSNMSEKDEIGEKDSKAKEEKDVKVEEEKDIKAEEEKDVKVKEEEDQEDEEDEKLDEKEVVKKDATEAKEVRSDTTEKVKETEEEVKDVKAEKKNDEP